MKELAQDCLKWCSNCQIVGIMACDEAGTISNKGRLPWHNSIDLAFLKEITSDRTIIMGRKTFDALPQSFLRNRSAIVLSKQVVRSTSNVQQFSSLDEFKRIFHVASPPAFMIGGAKTAEFFLANNLISKFILTKIHGIYKGDSKLNLGLFSSWYIENSHQFQNCTIELYSK